MGGTEARVYLAPGKGWGRLPGERMGEAVLEGGASRRRDVRKPLAYPVRQGAGREDNLWCKGEWLEH